MKIAMAVPVPTRSKRGNRVTATRWARMLRALGHRVRMTPCNASPRADVLLALHARKSYPAVAAFHGRFPNRPIIVALTGTDLYGGLDHPLAMSSLELADRLILLQPLGREVLPHRLKDKSFVILQSAEPPKRLPTKSARYFDLCVLGHMRPVKDPFRAAMAVRYLPADSRVRVWHLGEALTTDMAEQARAEARDNPRYHWLGPMPRWRAMRKLAACRLLVLSSHSEGGANAISEAIVSGLPVLASQIPGSVGMLGEAYPGFFPVGDTRALTALIARCETESPFYQALEAWCRELAPQFHPQREQAALAQLLADLSAC